MSAVTMPHDTMKTTSYAPPMTSRQPGRYDDEKLVPAVKDLKELIDELHKVFDSDHVNIEYVKALMAQYRSNPQDWKEFAKFDPFRYTRNLVDEGNGRFNLIALCWGEGQGSSIHDHSSADCFMKMLAGELVETSYAWPDSSLTGGERPNRPETDEGQGEEEEAPMVETGKKVLSKDAVAYINDTIGLHRVENASHSNKAVSLHLYSPPFSACHTFDQRTSHQRVAHITFWTKYGKRVNTSADEVNECSEVRVPSTDIVK